MWSEKHRPVSVSEMVGNEESRAALVRWFSKWRKGTRPILLVGPPGTGKTTVATLAARQFGYDMIGLNASDVRSKSKINDILGPVLGNTGIMGSPMIFIDEVDGIHGRADFGGAEALIKVLKDPAVPIVLAANSDLSSKMKSIKKAATVIPFKRLSPRLLRMYLQSVLLKEGAVLGPGAMVRVISESRGDIRSMLNASQSVATGFSRDTAKSPEMLDVEGGVGAFFRAESAGEARRILRLMVGDPREKISAFYASVVTSKLEPKLRSRMLDALSEADQLYGRIMRTQQWRLLRYLDEVLMRLYVPNTSIQYARYNVSWPVLNRIMWDSKKLKAVTALLAGALHTSRSTFTALYLPYLLLMMRNNSIRLDLDEDATSVLAKEAARG